MSRSPLVHGQPAGRRLARELGRLPTDDELHAAWSELADRGIVRGSNPDDREVFTGAARRSAADELVYDRETRAHAVINAARERGRERNTGGAMGYRVAPAAGGLCPCGLAWYAYADDEIAGVALAFVEHVDRLHAGDVGISPT